MPRARRTQPYKTKLMQQITAPKPEGRHQRMVRPPAAPGVGGAPPVYDAVRFPHIAKILCEKHGFDDEQLAEVFGVSIRTIYSWNIKYPEFKQAKQEGKDKFDGVAVENTLLKLALGYEYKERSERTVHVRGLDAEGNKLRVPAKEVTVTTKMLAPNAKAIMFWLTNRQPERWKMVTTVNANINSNTTHTERIEQVSTADISKMNSEQLRFLRDMISNQKTDTLQIENNVNEEVSMQSFLEQADKIVDAQYVSQP